jgi:hypothetical protein
MPYGQSAIPDSMRRTTGKKLLKALQLTFKRVHNLQREAKNTA